MVWAGRCLAAASSPAAAHTQLTLAKCDAAGAGQLWAEDGGLLRAGADRAYCLNVGVAAPCVVQHGSKGGHDVTGRLNGSLPLVALALPHPHTPRPACGPSGGCARRHTHTDTACSALAKRRAKS